MVRIGSQPTLAREADLLRRLGHAVLALGGDAGYFMARAQDRVKDVHHVLMACDPRWGSEYEFLDCYLTDPWFRYAAANSAPARAGDIPCRSSRERAVVDLAERFGFQEAIVFPAPSPLGRARVALLVVGSRDPAFQERMKSTEYVAEARNVSMALHEDWTNKLRSDLAESSELSSLDIRILELELQGSRTKAIAKTLGTTCMAIDSRFQRLKNKLHVTGRRSAAIRALEFGLIAAPEQEPMQHSRGRTRR